MRLRIFVIDDEHFISESLKIYLEALGHEVLTASDPSRFPVCKGDKCDKEYPCCDLLLIDYHMPKMTGLEFIKMQLDRGCKAKPQNKVIVTGNPKNIDMHQVKHLGCRIMEKPLRFSQIKEIVGGVINELPPDRVLSELPLAIF